MDNDTAAIESRANRIGVMLQVLNQIMEDCDKEQIKFNQLVEAAESLWALRNNKSTWDCGAKPDEKSAVEVACQ